MCLCMLKLKLNLAETFSYIQIFLFPLYRLLNLDGNFIKALKLKGTSKTVHCLVEVKKRNRRRKEEDMVSFAD